MAEKKTTKAAAPKAAPKAAPAKKAAAPAKKVEVYFDAVNAGFKAGEVYQVLAAAGKAMTVAEIAKKAKASNEEVILDGSSRKVRLLALTTRLFSLNI